MKKFLNTALAALAFAWLWASHAEAMDIEVRPPFVVLSGNVTGIELRILKNAIDDNPGITTVVLKDSRGGDARTSYLVPEYIRRKGLNTTVSGYCRSACAHMFLGGNVRSFSDDQPLDKTYVGFHGTYDQDRNRMHATASSMKSWSIKYTDGKVNPQLVDQWVVIDYPRGFAYFYHPQATVDAGPQRVMVCKGTEDPDKRWQQCAKPVLGNALDNGILTTLEIVKMNKQQPQPQQEQAKP